MRKKVMSGKVRIMKDDDIETVNNDKDISSKKVRGSMIRKINMEYLDDTKVVRNTSAKIRETKADREIEQSDNMSVVMMILIIVICFIVGIAIGYVLYNISIDSSNTAYIIRNILKL